MTTRPRRLAGALGGAVLAVAGATAGVAPAHANPSWTLYNEGTGAPLAAGDVLAATGTIVMGATVAGSPHNVTCTFDATHSLTLTSTGPFSGAPGTVLTVSAAPPPTMSCKNQAGVLIPMTKSGTWGVSITLPAAGSTPGQLYNGTLTGSLNVPANGVTANMSAIVAGCTATGPTLAKSFTGSYSASTGVVTQSGTQGFAVTSTGCVVTSTRITSATFTLDPVIDLQW
ncbi:hypothetical protein [Nocardioides sp. LML1-1-1.1]|uniref:hypothetical protein n=1 Tax=Nocardioides sp. LML1-1-1.1 TaxID=3135248 RepID=UPI0034381E0C